jgi:hypothetical protein
MPAMAVVLIATTLFTWQVQSALRANQETNTFQSLAREAAPFEHLIQNRASELRNELALWASRKDSGLPLESENFDAIVWIDSKGQIQWSENGRAHFEKSWLQGINFDKLRDGEAYFFKRSEADGTSGFALLTSAQVAGQIAGQVAGQEAEQGDDKIYLLGVLSSSALSNLVDDWVGSSRSALIFDDKGYVLAGTSRRLVGTSIKDAALVKAALNKQNTYVSGKFDDLDGRSSAAYSERVNRTNLHLALEVESHWLGDAIAKNVQECFWLSLLFFSGCVWGLLALWLRRSQAPAETLLPPVLNPAPVSSEALQSKADKKSHPPIEVPPLNFELIEQKAKHNVQEILEKSAQIRARLNLDFIEEVERWSGPAEAPAEEPADAFPVPPKIKVRRPQVNL